MSANDPTLSSDRSPTADVPFSVPDHELLRHISSGAYGEVWLARSVTGSYRAVKIVRRASFESEKSYGREFHGVEKVEPISREHEGLVDILHVGRNDPQGFFYYVMEVADDTSTGRNIDPSRYSPRTLSTTLTGDHRLQIEECIRIGVSLTAALGHLHRNGLIHRDIKPANIVFVNGVPKLADIGLVTDVGQSSYAGTPGYIPPEGPGRPQADLFSLGKVLYQLATGKNPQDFPELPTAVPSMSNSEELMALNRVILMACENNVRSRYQSAEQMHADLERLQQGKDLKTSTGLESSPHNLPPQLTSFIGREKEMTEVKRLLKTTRLLTLTGSGGCGKTRLALEVASRLVADSPDGVWLVELAALSNPTLVPQAVAAVLGVSEEPNRPLTKTLLDAIRPKRLLLLLDNCEHLVESCGQFVETLLRSCPKAQILATSRERLGIAGEVSWHVLALSVPKPKLRSDAEDGLYEKLKHAESISEAQRLPLIEQLLQYEAVRLFIDRAVAVRPDFAVTNTNALSISRICYELGATPLAIELAAARVRVLSAEQIAARLYDHFRVGAGGSLTAPARQQSLRALTAWSYDLLSDAERALLRRLSVFAGGFSLEAAEAVCTDVAGESAVNPNSILDLLTRLVDKSLVLADEHRGIVRYRLLETIRQYGREKLEESREELATRGRHCDFFLEVAERAEVQLCGAQQAIWLERLETEHDNIRMALHFSVENQQAEAGLRLGGALWRFWWLRCYFTEGQTQLMRLLGLPASSERTSARAKALCGAGTLAWHHFDLAKGCSLLEQSVAICREIGGKRQLALSLSFLGFVTHLQGETTRAVSFVEESLTLFREIGDRLGAALSLCHLAQLALREGDSTKAGLAAQESVELSREAGDKAGLAYSLIVLAAFSGPPNRQALLEECLEIQRELGNKWLVAKVRTSLAAICLSRGELTTARSFCEVASAIWKELDFAVETAWLLKDLGSVAKREGDVAKARALFSDGLAIGRESSDKGAIPALLNAIAAEVIDLKDYRQARMLYEESLAIQRECGKKEDVQWLRETLEHLPRRESRVLRGVAGRSLDSANEMTAGQGIRTEKHAPNVETAIAYVQIRNRFGIHHAPSALFVKTAGRYQCDITVEMVSAGQVPVSRDSNFNRYFQRDITVERVGETREESDFMGLDQVNGKSIMGLTMLQAGNGARLRITASGSGANKAVHELEELVERGFDEA